MTRLYRFSAVLAFILCLFNLPIFSQWIKQSVNTSAGFRGLAVVSERVIWASGTGGTVIRTIDGGQKWDVIHVPDAAKLDFRDIEAFDANTAYILSIGNGESSRIYKTIDGGTTWNLQFRNTDERAFFDALACVNRDVCVAVSDPIQGHFAFVYTDSGGGGWGNDCCGSPAAKDGEAAFAASGTCLVVSGKRVFLVSGGSDARVFQLTYSRGGEPKWNIANTSIVKGTAGSGIFGIAMFDLKNGVIVGGNYEKPNEKNNNLAFTHDGGKTWILGNGIPGFRSGVTYVDKKMIVVVGSSGSDMSPDVGKTWKSIDKLSYNAVAAKGKKAIWAVGDRGMVAKMK